MCAYRKLNAKHRTEGVGYPDNDSRCDLVDDIVIEAADWRTAISIAETNMEVDVSNVKLS